MNQKLLNVGHNNLYIKGAGHLNQYIAPMPRNRDKIRWFFFCLFHWCHAHRWPVSIGRHLCDVGGSLCDVYHVGSSPSFAHYGRRDNNNYNNKQVENIRMNILNHQVKRESRAMTDGWQTCRRNANDGKYTRQTPRKQSRTDGFRSFKQLTLAFLPFIYANLNRPFSILHYYYIECERWEVGAVGKSGFGTNTKCNAWALISYEWDFVYVLIFPYMEYIIRVCESGKHSHTPSNACENIADFVYFFGSPCVCEALHTKKNHKMLCIHRLYS